MHLGPPPGSQRGQAQGLVVGLRLWRTLHAPSSVLHWYLDPLLPERLYEYPSCIWPIRINHVVDSNIGHSHASHVFWHRYARHLATSQAIRVIQSELRFFIIDPLEPLWLGGQRHEFNVVRRAVWWRILCHGAHGTIAKRANEILRSKEPTPATYYI